MGQTDRIQGCTLLWIRSSWIMAFMLSMVLGSVTSRAVDPPKIFFGHSTLNKSGVTSGIKGQENFLPLSLSHVDKKDDKTRMEDLSFMVLLPDFIEVVGITPRFPANPVTTVLVGDPRLTVEEVVWRGQPYQEVRFLAGGAGRRDILWYEVREDRVIPATPQKIEVTLYHGDQPLHKDTSVLKIYEALEMPPRLPPEHYKLWLYRGPWWRNGAWDELADSLGKAGINALLFGVGLPFDPGEVECMKEMRKRGFYIISSTGGGYAFDDSPRSIYKAVERGLGRGGDDPVSMGPRWFEEADGGVMEFYLPFSDAALWNFEPGARVSLIPVDPWNASQFKKLVGIPPDQEIDVVIDVRKMATTDNWVKSKAIEPDKIEQWMNHRRKQISLCIKYWGDFVRGIKPGIETIITEGNMGVEPGSGRDLGYENFGDYVTYCQPMWFSGPAALQKMKKYMKRAPNARFLGCQNVSNGSFARVTVPAHEIMLQTVGAALIGCKGVGLYAGLSMDAEDFVHLNRAMGFLGRNQKLIFEGTPDPTNVTLEILPEHDPDLMRDLTSRIYKSPQRDEYLVTVLNYNKSKPAYLKIALTTRGGTWFIVDQENERVLASKGNPEFSSRMLGEGVYLKCPAYDYRGFRIVPVSTEGGKAIKAYQSVEVLTTKLEARRVGD